jgi:hypothetical protein
LVQHELLKAVREQIPHAYTRAGREFGLTVEGTQQLIDRKIEIISAAKAIKLARIIAYEPQAREVFNDAGHNVIEVLSRNFPSLVKGMTRGMPRPLRVRIALGWTRYLAHNFAGSVHEIAVKHHRGGLALSIFDGVFAERLDTLGCAHSYYRRILQSMFEQVAHVESQVAEIKRPRTRLNQCHFQIVWEA